MKKIITISLIAMLVIGNLNAQKYYPHVAQNTDEVEALFSVDEENTKLNFNIVAPKGINLYLALNDLSEWKGKSDFASVMKVAQEHILLYNDSLKNFANTRRIDVRISGDRQENISRYAASSINNNLRVGKDSKSSRQLKTGKDTLQLISVGEAREFRNLLHVPKVQYVLTAKDLSVLNVLLTDEKWIRETAIIIDSVINIYKRKWKKPELNRRTVYVKYDTSNTNKSLKISGHPILNEKRIADLIVVNGGVGVSLVRSTLCPSINYGVQLNFGERSYRKYGKFVRFSAFGCARFVESSPNVIGGYGLSFFNAEYGWQNKLSDSKQFLLSVGFGYSPYTGFDPSFERQSYKIFLNYGLSKRIILQPEFILGKKGYQGISVNFQLF